MKIWNTYKEGYKEFRVMFPTREYQIDQLKKQIIYPSTTRETALHNQQITKQIKELND